MTSGKNRLLALCPDPPSPPQAFPKRSPSFCIRFSSTLWVPASHPTLPVECLPSALRGPPEAFCGGASPTSAPGQLSPPWRLGMGHRVGVGGWSLKNCQLPQASIHFLLSHSPWVCGTSDHPTWGGGWGQGSPRPGTLETPPPSSNLLLHMILSKPLHLSSDPTNETAG